MNTESDTRSEIVVWQNPAGESQVPVLKRCRDLIRCSTESARKLVPYPIARKLRVLPLSLIRGVHGSEQLLVLASADLSTEEFQELRFSAQRELLVEVDLASESDLLRAIELAYLGSADRVSELLVRAQNTCVPKQVLESENKTVENRPIPELLSSLLLRAIALQASDIHLDPQEHSVRVRLRIDGELRDDRGFAPAPELAAALIRRLKVLCAVDHTSYHTPQEAGFSFAHADRNIRIRVSFMPQLFGEKVALRILDHVDSAQEAHFSFSALGLNREQTQLFESCLGLNAGTILVSGPTGSGKSTLLYAALRSLNSGVRNIVTLEDPVERILPGVNQIEVSRQPGRDYADFLPLILRQDPDVLLIGEMRDAVTAQTALVAGMTGHLVLSTVHAGDCLEVFSRLRQLGLSVDLITSSLRLVVACRLVPQNCAHCRRIVDSPEVFQEYFRIPTDVPLFESSGCAKCAHSGMNGRLGVFEFLPITQGVKRALHGSFQLVADQETELGTEASRAGYRPYRLAIREALYQGIISPTRALRALGLSAPSLINILRANGSSWAV